MAERMVANKKAKALTAASLVLVFLAGSGAGVGATTETVIHSFTGGVDGVDPFGPLTADRAGSLYGAAGSRAEGWGEVFKLTPSGTGKTSWTLTVLYSFTNGRDGSFAHAPLIIDSAGAIYGVADGGADQAGVVFKLTPPPGGKAAWTETVLHTFTGGRDGGSPGSGLIADRSGALYGTAGDGGNGGAGVVFKMAPPATDKNSWAETVLYNFSGGKDGGYPGGSLVADGSGALFGIASGGGPNTFGVVFKLTPPSAGKAAWAQKVLHAFTDFDVGRPTGTLIADGNGGFFGTTVDGRDQGVSSVFRLTPPVAGDGAWRETVLVTIPNDRDGGGINNPLLLDRSGALYGTTHYGGLPTACPSSDSPQLSGCGVVFKLTPPAAGKSAWAETILHSFTGGNDGATPGNVGLIPDSTGALYGTTESGGVDNFGLVFKITGSGFNP